MITADNPLTRMMNASLQKLIQYDDDASHKLKPHAGKKVRIHLEPINLSWVIEIDAQTLSVHDDADVDVDTTISGKPSALFAMSTSQHITGLDTVTINGDASAGQFVADFLKQLRPDWEEAWCDLLGDTVGYQVSQFIHGAVQMGGKLLQSMQQSSKEFLLEENRELVSLHEMDTFLDQVDDLQADTLRLERQLKSLTS